MTQQNSGSEFIQNYFNREFKHWAGTDPTSVGGSDITLGYGFYSPGEVFEPFTILVTPQCKLIWRGSGDQGWISFYQVVREGGWGIEYKPLGDFAVLNNSADGGFQHGAFVIGVADNEHPVELATPVGYIEAFNDRGSGNPSNLSAWMPIPPPGYAALGLRFTNGEAPDPDSMWCVKEEYTLKVSSQGYWGDAGMGFYDDGQLLKASFGSPPPKVQGKLLLLPPTYHYEQATYREKDEPGDIPGLLNIFDVTGIPEAVVRKSSNMKRRHRRVMQSPGYAPVPDTVTMEPRALMVNPASTPYFEKSIAEAPHLSGYQSPGVGYQLSPGIEGLTILPYTAFVDLAVPLQPSYSPFYYIVNESYYELAAFAENQYGHEKQPAHEDHEIGFQQTDTESFEQKTSIKVGAEVGVEFGGASAKASFEMTQELGISNTKETLQSTSKAQTFEAEAQPGQSSSLWLRGHRIALYRRDGSLFQKIEAPTFLDQVGADYPPPN